MRSSVATLCIGLVAANATPWSPWHHDPVKVTVTSISVTTVAVTSMMTVGRYCNGTVPPYPTTSSSIPASMVTPTSSTTSETCTTSALPETFHIKASSSSNDNFLFANLANGLVVDNQSSSADATDFHINSTCDGPYSGLDQLSFNYTDTSTNISTEYSVWVPGGAAGISDLAFFNTSMEANLTGYEMVIATFSTYLCQLTLRA